MSAETDFWFSRIARVENPVIVDVGANVGDYIPDHGIVHAFEPNPAVFETLKEKASDRVFVYPYAIDASARRAILNVPVDDWRTGIATLGTPRAERQSLAWKQIEVDTVKLDDLNLGHVDFLKIDTEGNEYNVLCGAEKLIRNYRPEILVEYTSLNTRQCGYEKELILETLRHWGYNEFREIGREDLWAKVSDEVRDNLHRLVVCQAGCGSRSTATGFSKAGLMCTHERLFTFSGGYPKMEWWRHVDVEVSWLAVHHLAKFAAENPHVQIVQLVRHPFRLVESVYDAGLLYAEHFGVYVLFLHNSLPSLHDLPNNWDKTAHYVIEWDKRMEPHVDLWHRIEDGVPALMDRLGIDFDPALDERHHASNKVHPTLERGMIQDHLWEGLERLVEKYGY